MLFSLLLKYHIDYIHLQCLNLLRWWCKWWDRIL